MGFRFDKIIFLKNTYKICSIKIICYLCTSKRNSVIQAMDDTKEFIERYV